MSATVLFGLARQSAVIASVAWQSVFYHSGGSRNQAYSPLSLYEREIERDFNHIVIPRASGESIEPKPILAQARIQQSFVIARETKQSVSNSYSEKYHNCHSEESIPEHSRRATEESQSGAGEFITIAESLRPN